MTVHHEQKDGPIQSRSCGDISGTITKQAFDVVVVGAGVVGLGDSRRPSDACLASFLRLVRDALLFYAVLVCGLGDGVGVAFLRIPAGGFAGRPGALVLGLAYAGRHDLHLWETRVF